MTKVLDVCCGSKRFYFDVDTPNVTFMDIRKESGIVYGKKYNVDPDIVGDFRNIPFPDESFDLVIFDPPHCKWAGENSITAKQYGVLDKMFWPDDINEGMAECMRVAKKTGTIIFKWNECKIPLKEVLKALDPFKPLFGNKRAKTI